jgi:hypothetical protein
MENKFFYTIPGYRITALKRKSVKWNFAGATVLSLIVIIIAAFIPVHTVARFYPSCPWWSLTHTYCPGCGTMRGISAMAHGHIGGLFVYNKFAFFCLPVLLYAYGNLASQVLFGYQFPVIKLRAVSLYLFILIIIFYWILRNMVPMLAPPLMNPF